MHPRIHVLQGEVAICSPINKESTQLKPITHFHHPSYLVQFMTYYNAVWTRDI